MCSCFYLLHFSVDTAAVVMELFGVGAKSVQHAVAVGSGGGGGDLPAAHQTAWMLI